MNTGGASSGIGSATAGGGVVGAGSASSAFGGASPFFGGFVDQPAPVFSFAIRTILEPSATPPALTETSCGDGGDVEVVVSNVDWQHARFSIAPSQNAPLDLYYSIANGTSWDLYKVSKEGCTSEKLPFVSSADWFAVTGTSLVLREGPILKERALSDLSKDSTIPSPGRVIGATADGVILFEGGTSVLLERFSSGKFTPWLHTDPPCDLNAGYSSTEVATLTGGPGFLALGYNCGAFISSERASTFALPAVYQGSLFHGGDGYYCAAKSSSEALEYPKSGLYRLRIGESAQTLLVEGLCEVAAANQHGIFLQTPSGLVLTAHDGSSPRLLGNINIVGSDTAFQIDDTHLYYRDGAALKRLKL